MKHNSSVRIAGGSEAVAISDPSVINNREHIFATAKTYYSRNSRFKNNIKTNLLLNENGLTQELCSVKC